MNKISRNLIILLSFFLVAGCQWRGGEKKQLAAETVSQSDSVGVPGNPVYASGWQITRQNGVRLLTIHDPQRSSGQNYKFALVPRDLSNPQIPEGYTVIKLPVQRVICMTTLQLSNFIRLDATSNVVGITSTRHLFNERMQQQLKSGHTAKIGIEGNFNNEMVMALSPDIILISPYKRGGYDVLKDVDIPLVPHLGYKEMTPLAQAEWIRLMGILLGEEEKADAAFSQIEKRYTELKNLVKDVKKRPVVFSGELHGGNWYSVGGQSFLAQLFRDAGADYFLKDNKASGGVTLDFETIYSQADQADYWRILNSYNGKYTYDVLKDSDERYADFKAFKNKKVIYCNLREKPYYEMMPVAPECLLGDFIKVFHPDLLPDYEPVFYELLR